MADMEYTSDNVVFPDPDSADTDGLLAVGGNLEVPTLIKAYSKGIFPWYTEGTPILWWSPDPRMVLFPGKFRVSKTLQQVIHSEKFEIRFDDSFDEVIEHCAKIKRKGQHGTWLTDAMIDAYKKLHIAGYAHSVETFYKGKLEGGLYGISLGGTFFGESMFYQMKDASKVALYFLVKRLLEWEFDLIDTQQSTKHLTSLGAEEIPRREFLGLLEKSLKKETIRGRWGR